MRRDPYRETLSLEDNSGILIFTLSQLGKDTIQMFMNHCIRTNSGRTLRQCLGTKALSRSALSAHQIHCAAKEFWNGPG
jgi:hypothetical protein